MFEIGRVVYKIAGRDSNKVAVIVEVIDDKYVMIDGNTRRKKVNVLHIEPTQKTIGVKKNAATADVIAALEKAGFVLEKKGESHKTPDRKKSSKAAKSKPAADSTATASASAPKSNASAAAKPAKK